MSRRYSTTVAASTWLMRSRIGRSLAKGPTTTDSVARSESLRPSKTPLAAKASSRKSASRLTWRSTMVAMVSCGRANSNHSSPQLTRFG